MDFVRFHTPEEIDRAIEPQFPETDLVTTKFAENAVK